MDIEKLQNEYTDWLVENLPREYVESQDCSAESILFESLEGGQLTLNDEQKKWLKDFINRWEKVEKSEEFPFEEIRKPSGDYFDNWQDAKNHGYDDDQIWSVTVHEETFCYGPPEHYVNHIGHIATKERHDGKTYYEENA